MADEHDSEDEQDVFALEGRTGQDLQEQTIQTLDEAAADPSISRGGWEGAAATQDVVPVASTSDRSPIDETADTLDSLMELTFDHLLWRCNDAAQLQRTWAVMLAAFDRTLLHTYRSKFTQFLVYYMCQQVSALPETTISFCPSSMLSSKPSCCSSCGISWLSHTSLQIHRLWLITVMPIPAFLL